WETVGKQQHAIGNFMADAGKVHEFLARDFHGQFAQSFQIDSSLSDGSRSFEQIRRSESHFARAQLRFRCARQTSRTWEAECRRILRRGWNRLAETLAQYGNDLPDLHDLFRGGKNERREAFPWILPEQPQPATRVDRGANRLIIRKSAHNRA